MNKRVLIILHQENSTPARVGNQLTAMGYQLDMRRPRFGDPLPETMDDHAGVIIFGGPMSANDDDDYMRLETNWLAVPLKENKPALGICLGAQMMARFLGERVYKPENEEVEIGYYPVEPTSAGNALCAEPFPDFVYQWHREGFDLPGGATLLASGDEIFPVQAFQYGSAAALQFHPEVTYAIMNRWTTRGHDRMQTPSAKPRHLHLEGWYRFDPPVATWLRAFLETWITGDSSNNTGKPRINPP